MRGELDFAESLRERVATLAGVPVSALDEVRRRTTFTPGARELVDECHAAGLGRRRSCRAASPRSSRRSPPSSGITRFRANHLEVDDGVLTGRTAGQVVDRAVQGADAPRDRGRARASGIERHRGRSVTAPTTST